MSNIRLKGHVDANHQLTAQETVAEEQWANAISREWASEWNDPREDIYTITDGEAKEMK